MKEVNMINKYLSGILKINSGFLLSKTRQNTAKKCEFCDCEKLTWCPTTNNYYCSDCNKYQSDLFIKYINGRYIDS